MNNKQAQTVSALRKSIGRVLAADQGMALRIRYIGSPDGSKDYADAVLVSATSLVLSVNGVADTTVGTTGTLLFATYTTLGALADVINLSANWKAEIVAGLRSDTVNGSELLARSTSTFKPWTEVDFYWDSSDNGVLGIDFLLEPAPAFSRPDQVKSHRVGLKRIRALVNSNAGEDIQIYVYELLPNKAAIYRTLDQFTATDNTAFDSGVVDEPLVHADFGNSLLIRFRGTGWIDTAAYLRVSGIRE